MHCTYGLNPAEYYTALGMSFDCMIKHTRVELELLNDYDQFLMVQDGVRDGLTQAVRRYSKANNYINYIIIQHPDYDKTTPYTWIIYLDVNNL